MQTLLTSFACTFAITACISDSPRDFDGTAPPPDTTTRPEVDASDCDDGCVIADSCRAPGEVNPDNACEACDPARDVDGWSPVTDQRTCDDKVGCTTGDRCGDGDGVCAGAVRPECTDLPACVTDVKCAATCTFTVAPGNCYIDGVCVTAGLGPGGDPCRACDPSEDVSDWTFTTASCDDGDACTYEDTCSLGRCAGQRNTCSDQLACTVDFCDGGVCQHNISGAACILDGACVGPGPIAVGQPCLVCDPNVSQTTAVVAVGDFCEDGDVCTALSTCDENGACVGAPVQLDREPNDAFGDAQDLGNIGAPDQFPSGSEPGSLPDGDVDFFRWGMTMTNLELSFRPRARVRRRAGVGVELCLYARCGQTVQAFAAPALQCPTDTRADELNATTRGCCRADDGGDEVELELPAACLPGLVQGFAYAKVTATGAVDALACGGYDLVWGAQ